MHNALKMHEENKEFEAYLLIKSRIENECRNGIRGVLLQKLDQEYLAGGSENELMEVLRMMKNDLLLRLIDDIGLEREIGHQKEC